MPLSRYPQGYFVSLMRKNDSPHLSFDDFRDAMPKHVYPHTPHSTSHRSTPHPHHTPHSDSTTKGAFNIRYSLNHRFTHSPIHSHTQSFTHLPTHTHARTYTYSLKWFALFYQCIHCYLAGLKCGHVIHVNSPSTVFLTCQ